MIDGVIPTPLTFLGLLLLLLVVMRTTAGDPCVTPATVVKTCCGVSQPVALPIATMVDDEEDSMKLVGFVAVVTTSVRVGSSPAGDFVSFTVGSSVTIAAFVATRDDGVELLVPFDDSVVPKTDVTVAVIRSGNSEEDEVVNVFGDIEVVNVVNAFVAEDADDDVDVTDDADDVYVTPVVLTNEDNALTACVTALSATPVVSDAIFCIDNGDELDVVVVGATVVDVTVDDDVLTDVVVDDDEDSMG